MYTVILIRYGTTYSMNVFVSEAAKGGGSNNKINIVI